MSYRGQNSYYPYDRPKTYYSNNRLYPGSYAPTEYPTRTSRRIHDGFVLDRNYGLDTTSDDINSSPYSTPYYINGRYNSDNLITQRANSASVQGCTRLLTIGDEIHDFEKEEIQTTLELWQGKQIKFEIPYDGKVVGTTVSVKNTDHCTGILSIYLSASDGGRPLAEIAVDLCNVSEDKLEHFELYAMTPVSQRANPLGKLYVRMEIWDEISSERSANPFNTGRKIEIAATGAGSHYACEYTLTDKNLPANSEKYEYQMYPSRPLLGLIYNPYTSVPTDKLGAEKDGATVALNGYRYDLFAIQDANETKMIVYDQAMNKVIDNDIVLDGRTDHVYVVQVDDKIYYVDGWSPLQKFTIGKWESSIVEGDDDDTQPALGPGLIFKHLNRIFLGKFRYDPNLMQISMMDENGPLIEKFYRFYAPDQYPEETSINPVSAIVEYTNDNIYISGTEFASMFDDGVDMENNMPSQVSMFMDGIGVASQGDICNYKGILYSFDPDEGIRRFTGSVWNTLPNLVDSYTDRVDMDKPRKLWGYAQKLYFNYYDVVDGKAKCLIWDMDMNYQQYPWFQDCDIPFCDVRIHDDNDLIGIHPDFPCIMKLYSEDTWARLDTPITFERHTKRLSLPGGVGDIWVKRVHNKVLANSDRWWWFSLDVDKPYLTQFRGHDKWYRFPVWATKDVEEPVETPFPYEDLYEHDAVFECTISHLKIQCLSAQVKVKCKTFRNQASLLSTSLEIQPINTN